MKKRKKSSTKVDQGKVAEYVLAAEILARGGIPCWPSTAEVPYDLIVDINGRKLKVQVKGTIQPLPAHIRLKKAQGNYKKTDFDVLAVWSRPENNWFFIPMKEVLGKSSVALPALTSMKKILQFHFNWDILGL